MKTVFKYLMVAATLCGLVVFGTLKAWAADEAKCALPVSKNASISTSSCLNGWLADAGPYSGDGGCWTGNGQPPSSVSCKGMNVALQCDVDVYVDPTATAGGTASSSDFTIEFTNNKDPAYIYLKPTQGDIALRGVTADGGCNLGVTDRAKPTR